MLFAKGFLLGLSIAAPVGPIGLLCIRRTLQHGRLAGFVSGLGAAAADFLYALAAAAGVAVLLGPIREHEQIVRLAGGILLLAIGARILMEKPQPESAETPRVSLARCFGSTFLLTITNPLTILSFLAMYSGLGAAGAASLVVALGVLVGSAAWWLTLSGIAGLLRARIGAGSLRVISYAAGVIIAGFGLAAVLKK